MTRFICINNDYACQLLNERCIPFDFDGGDRIMVDDAYANEVRNLFDENDIKYDEI